jgi:hypothetical protein
MVGAYGAGFSLFASRPAIYPAPGVDVQSPPFHYQMTTSQARPKRMAWVIFVAGAVLSWGAYGALLHMGQTQLGSPLKALLCVGVAYFLIGIIVPVAGLSAQGNLSNFDTGGLVTATIAGALGAAGAACIIYSFRFGGLPVYVMPLVFGGAPIVNVLVSMAIHPPKQTLNPLLFVGFLFASIGAALVLYYRPTA